jgi:hypothetical protein
MVMKAQFQLVAAIAQEIQAELESLTACPAICEDGKVCVSPPSGTPRKARCPLLSETCPYGSALRGKLDLFLGRLAFEAGVPKRYIEDFNACIETPAFVWANRWSFSSFLVLSGGSGVGKSFSAAWVCREFLRRQISEPLDSNTWIRAAYAREHAMWTTVGRIVNDKDRLDEARSKWFLVLDDLGREGSLSTRQADVSDIVSVRYGAKLPTVITTELDFEGILKTYGKNTACKLLEGSERNENNQKNGGMFVWCGNVSLRRETVDICGLDDDR